MPGPVMRDPYANLPSWLRSALLAASTSPVSAAVPSTGAGPLAEWVGKILSAEGNAGRSFPRRLAFSALDPAKGRATLTALDRAGVSGRQFEAAPRDLAGLIRSGTLSPEPAPSSGATVPALVRRLQQILQGRTE